MPVVIRDPTPAWMRPPTPVQQPDVSEFGGIRPVSETPPEDARVTIARWIAQVIGADSPTAQVLMLMNPLAAGPEGGVVGAVQRFLKPIKAYHGSPHDFPAEPGAPLGRFRSEAIGTGEGAQAYGHGLYFAEKEGTARSYQRMNQGRRYQVGDRELVSSASRTTNAMNQSQAEIIAADALDEAFNAQSTSPAQFAANRLRDARRRYPEQAADIDEAMDIIAQWQESGLSSKPSGRMYEVNIHADPEGFLDWDAPVSQQSPRVQEALNNLWTKKGGTLEGRTEPPFTAHEGATGESVHAAIATSYAPTSAWKSGRDAAFKRAASEALQGEGIPGIKYLDQFSRGAGEGTRNYVVFDASKIEILRKYGLAGMVGAGLINQSLADQIAAGEITVQPELMPSHEGRF